MEQSKLCLFNLRAWTVPVVMMALSACSTTQESSGGLAPVQQDVRTTGQTAPAELQIACASAAPSRLRLASENILPTSSSEIQTGVYRVELKGKDVTAECIINIDGQIRSIERV